jgi:hypothetical protein
MSGLHPSHKTRFSDASSFDEICTLCGATDIVPGGWGALAKPCPKAKEDKEAGMKEEGEDATAVDAPSNDIPMAT